MADNVIEFVIKGDAANAVKAFSSMEDAVGHLSKAIGVLSIGAGLVKFAEFIDHQIEIADQFNKMSQRTGVATESLSRLAYAFELADLSMQDMDQAFKFMNRSVGEAIQGNTAAVNSFASLGITLKDLKNDKPDEMLLRLADAYTKIETPAERTTFLMENFGRAGLQLAPTFAKGAEGVRQLTAEAERLGLTVDKQFAEDAEKFKDHMKTMSAAADGVGRSIAKELLPPLNSFLDGMKDIAMSESAVQALEKYFLKVADAIKRAAYSVIDLNRALYDSFQTMWNKAAEEATGAFDKIKNFSFDSFVEGTKTSFRNMWDGVNALTTKAVDKLTEAGQALSDRWNGLNQTNVSSMEALSKAVTRTATTTDYVSKQQAAQLEETRKKYIDFYDSITVANAQAAGKRFVVIDAEFKRQLDKLNELKLSKQQHDAALVLLEQQKALAIYNVQTDLYSKLGAADAQNLARKEDLLQQELQLMWQAGVAGAAITDYARQQRAQADLDAFNARQQQRDTELQAHILNSQAIGDTLTASLSLWAVQYESFNQQVSGLVSSTMQTVVSGIGDAVAQALVYQKSLSDALSALFKQVVAGVISGLVQIGVQRLIIAAIASRAAATEAASGLSRGLAETYVNSFASAAAIPFVGWAIAPAAASANLTLATAGAAGAMAAGAGMGAAAGVAHGGMDFVPSESTFLLDEGERVISPRQNKDLTGFLDEQHEGGSGGGVSVGQLSIVVQVPNAQALRDMTRQDWEELTVSKILPALNVLNRKGVRPDAVQEYSR